MNDPVRSRGRRRPGTPRLAAAESATCRADARRSPAASFGFIDPRASWLSGFVTQWPRLIERHSVEAPLQFKMVWRNNQRISERHYLYTHPPAEYHPWVLGRFVTRPIGWALAGTGMLEGLGRRGAIALSS
jgi:hypothetical protein